MFQPVALFDGSFCSVYAGAISWPLMPTLEHLDRGRVFRRKLGERTSSFGKCVTNVAVSVGSMSFSNTAPVTSKSSYSFPISAPRKRPVRGAPAGDLEPIGAGLFADEVLVFHALQGGVN